ncbi:MAG TPA: SAM-dependent methyltransferase [Candidatus Pullilachnospira intestinigallinarum]|nr:SAM-dependent methyltransferase [Candidatus Pullilachnospira intestinigallinarum]
MNTYQITEWCSHFVREHVVPGDLCIDATMGNGHDTLLLSRLAGSAGRVLAFDIQQAALDATRKLLISRNAPDNTRLILDSHSHMASYADAETVSCIMFNFGYLPSGDHSLATCSETSIPAVLAGLDLLKPEGLMSLCIYSGGDTGFREKEDLLKLLKSLDCRKYLVIVSSYYNRPHHPPLPVLIRKLPER